MIKEEEKTSTPLTNEAPSTPVNLPTYQEKLVNLVESQDPTSPRGYLKGKGVKTPTPGPQKETCYVCNKSVYVNERVSVDGKIFHQDCFRCKYCKCKLNSSNMSQIKSEFYCKTHVLELFMKAGKYDVGSTVEKQEELTNSKNSVARRNDYTKEDLETIEKLEDYVKKGIIEEFEFNNKLESINEKYEKKPVNESPQISTVIVKNVHSPQVKQQKMERVEESNSPYSRDDQEAISKVEELHKMGILTNDERDAKINQITEKYKKNTSSKQSKMSDDDIQVLEKLKKLKDMGVLTDDEYSLKLKQINEKYQ